jgi:hypothetical protein
VAITSAAHWNTPRDVSTSNPPPGVPPIRAPTCNTARAVSMRTPAAAHSASSISAISLAARSQNNCPRVFSW